MGRARRQWRDGGGKASRGVGCLLPACQEVGRDASERLRQPHTYLQARVLHKELHRRLLNTATVPRVSHSLAASSQNCTRGNLGALH